MVWMTSFCFCFTVRLGGILSAIFSIMCKTVEVSFFIFYGTELVNGIVRMIENDAELKENFIFKSFTTYIKYNPDQFCIDVYIESAIYLISCLLCIYGTYKLKKWSLIPYIILQFLFVMRALILHITTMLLIKKYVNLGILIGLTIAGGFFVLLLGYQWSGSIGMYQIINLIRSPKYKAIYGDDPFYPIDLISKNSDTDSIENVKIFATPNYDEVDNLKSLNSVLTMKEKLHGDMDVNRISTINYYNNNENDLRNFWHINELVGFRKINRHSRFENSIGYF